MISQLRYDRLKPGDTVVFVDGADKLHARPIEERACGDHVEVDGGTLIHRLRIVGVLHPALAKRVST